MPEIVEEPSLQVQEATEVSKRSITEELNSLGQDVDAPASLDVPEDPVPNEPLRVPTLLRDISFKSDGLSRIPSSELAFYVDRMSEAAFENQEPEEPFKARKTTKRPALTRNIQKFSD